MKLKLITRQVNNAVFAINSDSNIYVNYSAATYWSNIEGYNSNLTISFLKRSNEGNDNMLCDW
jgi:hypothetical protein